MSEEQKNNVPLIGEIFVEGEAPPQYYQAFLDAQAKAEAAAGRAEAAAGQIVVDQEFIETQVFSVEQAAEISAVAARDAQTAAGAAAQSEQNTKDDADRAAGAADDAAAALARTEEVADSVGAPVSYKPQTLSKGAQAQAMENIGASTFYHTKREELGVAHEDINTEYIYGLYDALMAQYPGNVQKNEVHNDDGTFTNYEYVISTGEYSTDDAHYTEENVGGPDPGITKPKYLILSGIHGTERNAALSVYRFIRDVLSGHNVPQSFKEGVNIRVVPVGTPSAFNRFTRESEDGVDINRDFNADAPAKETQAIKNWLTANSDADLYIDAHNNGAINEVVAILGESDNDAVNTAKKIALKGVDRIISFWREVIGYPPVNVAYYLTDENGDNYKDANGEWATGTKKKNVVFSYSANSTIGGTSQIYASSVLSIPSITVELSVFYGDHEDRNGDTTYPPETLAAGAEAIGNILIEFYEQSFKGEVVAEMKVANNKLDALLLNASFRIEHGIVRGTTDTQLNDTYLFSIPLSKQPQLVIWRATDDTQDRITQLIKNTYQDEKKYVYGGIANFAKDIITKGSNEDEERNSALFYFNWYSSKWVMGSAMDGKQTYDGSNFAINTANFHTSFDNGDGTFTPAEYEWTAYYWDE